MLPQTAGSVWSLSTEKDYSSLPVQSLDFLLEECCTGEMTNYSLLSDLVSAAIKVENEEPASSYTGLLPVRGTTHVPGS